MVVNQKYVVFCCTTLKKERPEEGSNATIIQKPIDRSLSAERDIGSDVIL